MRMLYLSKALGSNHALHASADVLIHMRRHMRCQVRPAAAVPRQPGCSQPCGSRPQRTTPEPGSAVAAAATGLTARLLTDQPGGQVRSCQEHIWPLTETLGARQLARGPTLGFGYREARRPSTESALIAARCHQRSGSGPTAPLRRQVKIYSLGYMEQCAAGPSCSVRGGGLHAVLQRRELRGMSVRVRAICRCALACFLSEYFGARQSLVLGFRFISLGCGQTPSASCRWARDARPSR